MWTKFIDSGNHDTAAEVNANQQDVFVAGDCCIVQGAAIGTGSGFIAKLDENGNRAFVKHLTDGETHLNRIFEMTVDNDTQEYSLLVRCKTQETLFRW